jgi:hypothetical protein
MFKPYASKVGPSYAGTTDYMPATLFNKSPYKDRESKFIETT